MSLHTSFYQPLSLVSVHGLIQWMTRADHQIQFVLGDKGSNPSSAKMATEGYFRLLDLPVELQRLIFYHYFGGSYDITVDYERLTMLRSKFHILGLPPTNLLRVSKHVYELAAGARRDGFSGRLILNSVFILVPLRKQPRFEWLRLNTTILHFSDSSVHPERWSRYWDSFSSLKRLEICFPKIKEPDCVMGLDDVLAGKADEQLVASLDVFRMSLVDQLREDRLEVVVRQKFCAKKMEGEPLWDGLVDVKIRLSENGSEVIDRIHVMEKGVNGMVAKRATEAFVHANGNVLDAGSHRSLWEWHQAMTAT